MKIKDKHISEITAGDLVLCCDGVIRTVSSNNIKKCAFMGITIFGDCYALGYKPVKVVTTPAKHLATYQKSSEYSKL